MIEKSLFPNNSYGVESGGEPEHIPELTYNDFLQRLNIQELLVDAGYQLNKRDGLRYPSYVKVDSHGQRVRGDKFIVTGNGKCCFQPPE